MTIPRLRPMSDTDRPHPATMFYMCSDDTVEWMLVPQMYKAEPDDIGWCTLDEAKVILADLLERIKPHEPNPVYWGDEVKAGKPSRTYVYLSPRVGDPGRVWCEVRDYDPHTILCLRAADLTYNGRPVTEFRHGLRPKEER